MSDPTRPLVMTQSVWEKKYADPSPFLPDTFLSMVVELYCSYKFQYQTLINYKEELSMFCFHKRVPDIGKKFRSRKI